MYNRPYRFHFYDTASPENYTLLRPDFIVVCYAIDDRQTLKNAQAAVMTDVVKNFARERDDIPIMLLGLKRDLRVEGEGTIYPQEVSRCFQILALRDRDWGLMYSAKGYRIAQEMRCDRYAECSALTGELMDEVSEDIARTAAKTTTEAGGLSSGGCGLM